MTLPLFDQSPPHREIRARDLGAVETTYCTDSEGVIRFERGTLELSPEQWFALHTVFARPKGPNP